MKVIHFTGADPGFPVGGGANHTSYSGRQHMILPKFPKKLHEIEKSLGCGGRGGEGGLLDPSVL